MKKLLALVLALVMTLGLATVGSNAAFKDDADIDYKEAVDVMSAIGVLAGMEDGNFQPDGNLTREQGAKIIAYLVLGPAAADALTASKAPFADVEADRWSAGVIQYCVAEGIIAGIGNNKFGPTEPLTGYAFAKMALVALGYRADIEGLTGDDWALNTATLVRKLKLSDGIDGFAGSVTLNRQTAAQIGLNTLKATEVYYNTTNTLDSDGTTGVSTNIRSSKVVATGDEYLSGVGANDGFQQLVEDVFPKLKLNENGTDSYGRSANVWTFKGVKVGTYAKTANFVYTEELTSDAEKKELKATFEDYNNYNENNYGGSASKIALWKNGYHMADMTNADFAAELSALTGNGTKVEVFTKDNMITKVVVTETVLGKVVAVNKTKGEITVQAQFGAVTTNFASTDKGYGTFVKDDYVILTVKDADDGTIDTAKSKIETIAAATVVKGTAANKNTSKGTITLAGTTYEEGAQVLTANNVAAFAVSSKYDAKLYLDSYGYILYAKGGSASTDNKAVVVLDAYQSLDKDGKLVWMVKGMTSNGETVIWQANKDYTGDKDKVLVYTETDDVYTINSTGMVNSGTTNMADAETSLDYALTAGDSTPSISDKDKTFTTKYNQKLYYDSDVKFIYIDSANDKAVAKDGVQKVATGTTINLVVEKKDDVFYIVAVYVHAAGGNTVSSSNDIVFVDATHKTANGYSLTDKDNKVQDYYTYDAYINGEKLDLFYTKQNIGSSGFYSVEIDADNGNYVLTNNAITPYAANDELAVSAEETYAGYVNNLLSGTHDYDVSGATFVDCTGHDYDSVQDVKDAIADTTIKGAKFMVIYNSKTNVASYVFLSATT